MFSVEGSKASYSSVNDGKCSKFRVYWRKLTFEDRKRVNSDRGEAIESEYDSMEERRRAGIEDWIAYVDRLESKVEIENMASHNDDMKVMILVLYSMKFDNTRYLSNAAYKLLISNDSSKDFAMISNEDVIQFF